MIERVASNRTTNRDQRGFYGDMEDAGVRADVDTKIRKSEIRGPITERLGVPQGAEIVVRSRRMRGDGQLLQTAVTYLHPDVVAQVPQLGELDTGPGGMYARMEEAGHKLHQQDRVSARVPDADTQETFGVTGSVAMVVIERITRGTDGQILEITEISAPADRQVFVYDL